MMSVLAELLSSKIRAEVFRLLFGLDSGELHGRELSRRAGANEAATRQELRKLTGLGLVSSRRAGNRVYYRANFDHPLYPQIHGLVLKTVGLVDVIGRKTSGAEIDVAFVFGSIAKGTDSATSDIDLMVIGDVSLRQLTVVLAGVAETLGREVNPHVLSADEYRDRLARGDHFVTHVLSGPKIFVKGDQCELDAMGAVRMAQG